MKKFLPYFLFIFIAVFCTHSIVFAQKPSLQLSFIDEEIIQDSIYQGTLVGGFSGLDMAPDSSWYIISDSRMKQGGARIYTAKLDYDNQKIKNFEISNVMVINNLDGKSYAKAIPNSELANAETIRYEAKSNTFYWASEGEFTQESLIHPYLMQSNFNGTNHQPMKMPERLRYYPEKNRGLRDNKSIESLSLVPKSVEVWLSVEEPLYEDKIEKDSISPVRLTRFNPQTGKVSAEYAYLIDNLDGNGVVEILAINDKKILVLERAYSVAKKENYIHLYEADFAKATNLKDIPALSKKKYHTVKKTLILDFSDLKKQNKVKKVDNIEGMAWGHILPNGNQSLVFVSDDNFNRKKGQISQILVFEVIRK